MPRVVVPGMVRPAFVAGAFPVPARSMPFGFFFGFDFLAEFLFFGVSASTFFAFVVTIFD
jgi:hypothetical protein